MNTIHSGQGGKYGKMDIIMNMLARVGTARNNIVTNMITMAVILPLPALPSDFSGSVFKM